MAASSFVYNHAKAWGATISGVNLSYWSSTTASFYITLVSNNYTPNENNVYASAISGAELGAASFTSGYSGTIRISITGRILNVNTTSNQMEFQANSVTWSGIAAANGVAHAYVILQQSGTDAKSELIAYNSLGGFPITPNGTNLTISFTSAGVFNFQDY